MEKVAVTKPVETTGISLDEFCRTWSPVEKAAFRRYVGERGCGLVLQEWQWECLLDGFNANDLRQTQADVVYGGAG